VPKFVSVERQPHNMNKSEGEEAEFHCEAEGIPPPIVVWYRNGDKLDCKCLLPPPEVEVMQSFDVCM
jgi:hypothetical protein